MRAPHDTITETPHTQPASKLSLPQKTVKRKDSIKMGRRWKLPWTKKAPVTPETPRYNQVYSSRTSKGGSWLKQQGREILKQLPRTIAQAGIDAAIMTGIGTAMGPDQVAQGDNKKNQAIFLYDGSQGQGPSILETAAVIITCLLILIAFPLVIVSLRQYINICMCKWSKTPRTRVIEHTEDVSFEMEDAGRFGIQEIIKDLETRENGPRKPDIRKTVNKALENMDRQAFVKMEEGEGE